MGLFVKTLLPLSLCFLICAQLSGTASQSSNFAGHQNGENTLESMSSETTADLTALEAKISAMEADLTALKAKHCQTGQMNFFPNAQTEHVNGKYRHRKHTLQVTFSLPFSTVPWVAITLTGLNVDSDYDTSLRAGTSSVSTSGFDAHVIQWSDTRVFNATATWLACNM